MPLGLASQEFWLESNVGMCAWKLVDSKLRGPRNKWKIIYKKKKKKFVSILYENTPGQIGQKYLPKSNVSMFPWKLVDSIYRGPISNSMNINVF